MRRLPAVLLLVAASAECAAEAARMEADDEARVLEQLCRRLPGAP